MRSDMAHESEIKRSSDSYRELVDSGASQGEILNLSVLRNNQILIIYVDLAGNDVSRITSDL